ncbi:MAG TPA: hypothetical protein VLJ42_14060 [Solirubrobacteraceae bacterium]|nr:hypothetical protein [Solirubrobacteraceae bacterium]
MESATLTGLRPDSTWVARMRATPASSWARAGFVLLCAGALIGYFAFPTYPTYDSYYALIWGRDVLHLHLPDFQVYRAPTEHPLAIAFGVLISVFGRSGDRLMIAGSIASFVVLTAGLYRLGRLTFGPVVGAVAAIVLCTRFDYEFYAAQGYLDFPYMALVIWAAAFEAERARRGTSVFLLLAAAGLLRPEAWLLSGLYLLWCGWPACTGWVFKKNMVLRARAYARAAPSKMEQQHLRVGAGAPTVPGWRRLVTYAALTISAPLIWSAVDLIVTGDATYSLHSTTGLAEELGRTQGLANIPASTWQFMVRLDKLPLVAAAIAGVGIAIVLVPRRVRVPLSLLVAGLLTFGLLGAAGTSVIDRYLLTPAVLVMLFSAVTLGGWSLLEPGTLLRRAWISAALLVLAYGVVAAATTLSIASIQTQLAFRNDSHRALASVLDSPIVRSNLKRCGPLSLPNHKLMPDARWILNEGPHDIIARSQARINARKGDPKLRERISRGVAIYPTGSAVFRQAIVDSNDDPQDQVPLRGFSRELTSQYYAVYVHC